jgi:hypothetical protein
MIWILVLLLVASGVGMGLRLGAIPTAVSILAVMISSLFAGLVGKLFKFVLPHVGVTNPTAQWMVAPIFGFLLVYIILMSFGLEVHRRVYVFYKYKAGDLRLALWERLNYRLGACLGVLNGTIWLILVCFVLFNISYWTFQIAPSENEPKTTRLVNDVGAGMQSTGLDKPARAVGSVPDSYYRTANFAGLLFQNPDLSSRLASYPAFISLSENGTIQSLANDSSLTGAWQHGMTLADFRDNSNVKSILNDTNLIATIWNLVQANMDDLTNYLMTGQSPKYDSEKIVGRWAFDLIPALADYREAHPKMTPNDMKQIRAVWGQAYAQTTLVAGTDGQIFLKNVPEFKMQQPPTPETWTGTWSQNDTNYDLSMTVNGHTESGSAQTDGLRLTIKLSDKTFVFNRLYY